MTSEFRMPTLGADMEAGTLVEWLKNPGDAVTHGDIVAVVETQKGAIEIEIFDDGILDSLLVAPGETVPVGTPLARIRQADEAPASEPAPAHAPAPTPTPTVNAGEKPASHPAEPPAKPREKPPEKPQAVSEDRHRIDRREKRQRPSSGPVVTPAARMLAQQHGLDPKELRGSGPGGAILKGDVEAAVTAITKESGLTAAPDTGSAAPGPTDRKTAMRQAISAAMARSKREIPHYYLSTTIDMSASVQWLTSENDRRSVADRLLPAALLMKATALALKKFPDLNGTYGPEGFVPGQTVHLGWAIALRGGGLMAPGIAAADEKSLSELMASLRDLVQRTRQGGLRSSELSAPTITVTSLGDVGVETVFGVIFPPQVAIAGYGSIVTRPWATGDTVVTRPTITASLSADHRVSDGHLGAMFLQTVDRLLQEPEKL